MKKTLLLTCFGFLAMSTALQAQPDAPHRPLDPEPDYQSQSAAMADQGQTDNLQFDEEFTGIAQETGSFFLNLFSGAKQAAEAAWSAFYRTAFVGEVQHTKPDAPGAAGGQSIGSNPGAPPPNN